jgi:flagellin-specific chaperone FliS
MSDENRRLVDPDPIDLIIQALSAVSSVASLAATWMQVRSSGTTRQAINQEHIRQQIRQLERAFDDLFEELRSALRVMEPAFERQHQAALRDQPLRFGAAKLQLMQAEVNALTPSWQSLTVRFVETRNTSWSLEQTLQYNSYPGEEGITDDLAGINDAMNQLLFESKNYSEALDRLDDVRRRIRLLAETSGNGQLTSPRF